MWVDSLKLLNAHRTFIHSVLFTVHFVLQLYILYYMSINMDNTHYFLTLNVNLPCKTELLQIA